jgi:hypothetical protein
MIYYFKDPSRAKDLEKAQKAERDFLAKYPDGQIFKLSAENFTLAQWEELLAGGGLFAPKFLIVADGLLADKDIAALVEPTLDLAKASPNVFIILETPPAAAKPRFNIWAPADALAARDRRALWLLYQEAQATGFSKEEFFWKLAWKVKSLLLAARTGKPSRQYKTEELAALSGRLVRLWHDYRREANRDFAIGLERFILEV